MASTKKPGFMVETKLITEKKRRKSDLVVMWITLWDVILYVATEMWLTFQGVLEVGKLFFKTDEVRQIREWLDEYLQQVPEDFTQSWRDGILFCKLLNKLQPGCFPDANRLDTNFGVRNLSKAFRILETRFDITPKVTVEEIVTCSKDSESKLIDLLLQLKQKTDDNENNNEIKPTSEEDEKVKEDSTSEIKNCIAKGTGLMVGFVGRAASFGVFFSTLSDVNLVLEIRGPSNTICSERITKRSPKRKNIIKPWKPLSPHAVVRSSSNEESGTPTMDINQDFPKETEKCFIPLEYEMHSNQISFTYFPLTRGQHRIAILSHGQHVSDSPYIVTVEPSVRDPKTDNMVHIKSVLKPPRRSEKREEDEPKKSSVRFQEPSERKERLGKILKRQVLRYIVKIDGKDVVVDAHSINNLATSLLKMDYELQKRPVVRRNSWGFVGDAERKISAIRQFGIDLEELEAQSIKMQRSHSLSLSPITKKPSKLSSSYECEDIFQQTTLETVTEGRVSHFSNSSELHKEEDDVFALMNKDFYRLSDVNIEGTAEEQEDFDANSLKNYEDKVSENIFSDNDSKELDESFTAKQIQMSLKSEGINKQSLIQSVEEYEDALTSTNQYPSSLDLQIDEEFDKQKSETKTEMISSGANKNSQITGFSFSHGNHMVVGKSDKSEEDNFIEVRKRINVVENNIEEFKELEDTDSVFIEEIPFTKTDAKTLSNTRKNVLHLLGDTKEDSHKYEASKQLTRKKILDSDSKKCVSQTKEVNNAVNNSQCKFLKKANLFEGNLYCFVKNKHSINEQIKSKNIKIPKVRYKSFVYSNVQKNKTKRQRSHKCPHLGKKNQINCASFYTKERRSSSKSSIDDSLVNKLQCILQNMNYDDISSVSEMLSLKSTKNRTGSDPTYNLFNRNEESTNLNSSQNKNGHSAKFENKEENYKPKSHSSFKNSINTSSYLSNLCHKTNINRNEDGNKFLSVVSKEKTEFADLPQRLYKNYNIYHLSKNNNISKKYSEIYESLSASVMNPVPNDSCESFVKVNYENSSGCNEIRESTPKNTCQFTYKHFNPPFQFDRENIVKKQIKLWETSTVQKTDKPISKYIDKLHVLPELVDIKAKLKFWENAYHHSENEELKDINVSKSSNNTHEQEDRSDTARSISSGINLEESLEKQNQVPSDHGTKEEDNINNSNSLEKPTDSKMLNMDSAKSKMRSFSDPGVLDKPDNEIEDDSSMLLYRSEFVNPSSSKDELSSSNDGNFIELFADDEESSMELLCSTEDEYIDDEISENISTYWGDLSLMNGFKAHDSSEYEEFLQLMNSESLQSCADECKFFGIATYFGHVAVKNRFWVLTKGAGRGNLSTSVQGIGQHNVAFVSVEYTRKDIYEVTYQVFTPGLYLISVRWMDSPIPGSPFLCKVTY